jgi:hypothetical protein
VAGAELRAACKALANLARVSVLRSSALRRGRTAAVVLVCLACGGLVAASTARAGQIVWSTGSGIWAMRDDGSDPHELVSATQLAASLPRGTLASPDVFQNGGTTVLFLGQTTALAPGGQPQACGADCSGTYELAGGALTELGPAAASAAGSAYYERQPRLTADGKELFGSSLDTGISGATMAAPENALVERPLTVAAQPSEWGASGDKTEPGAGFDGAPDPADPTQAAWVEAQGCVGFHVSSGGASAASCQYAVLFGPMIGPSSVVIYDNELASANGDGPTSLALSSDGQTLLMVDPFAPNTGIYSMPVAGDPSTKPVTEVIAQPAGWTFGQARVAGEKIVFDAHDVVSGKPAGDIYAISAGCTAATCTFPANATNLTNDPTANSSDPAWTSANAPLQALKAAGLPRVMSVRASSHRLHAGHPLHLTVSLSAAGTIIVRFVRRVPGSHPPRSRSIGSLRVAGLAGANHLVISHVSGHALTAGSYTASIALGGSSASPKIVHFSVR